MPLLLLAPMNPRFAFTAALALSVAGCVTYVPHPLDPTRGAARLSERRLEEKTWTLKALIEEASRSHPNVAIARAQYQTARAAIHTAGERPNPTLALTPQIITPYTSLIAGTYGVDFDWTIESAGKRSRRLEVAHQGARAAAAHVIEAIWKTRSAVRKSFLELYAAQTRGKLLADAVSLQDGLLKALDARIDAGEEPRSAAAQPRLLRTQLRLQEADATRNAALAQAALADALGMGTRGIAGARFTFAAFEGLPRTSAAPRRAALTHRADVLVALAEYAASEGALRLEIAKQYPDLHLNPGYQLDAGIKKWTLGVGLTLPILNQNRGPIGEAAGKRGEAAAKFNAIQATVLAECDRAAAGVSAARAKLAVTEDLLSEQAKQLTSELHLVEAGAGDKLAVLSARVERASTLALRLDAWVELQAALGALEEATQSPLAQ